MMPRAQTRHEQRIEPWIWHQGRPAKAACPLCHHTHTNTCSPSFPSSLYTGGCGVWGHPCLSTAQPSVF